MSVQAAALHAGADSRKLRSIEGDVDRTLELMREDLGYSPDIVFREFRIGGLKKAALVYTDGLADSSQMHEMLIDSHLQEAPNVDARWFRDTFPSVPKLAEIADPDMLYTSILSGNSIVLVEGQTVAYSFDTPGWEQRAVSESSTQTVIRGPKEAFTENIRTNTALVRRRIKDPRLWMEHRYVGRITKTTVALMYVKGIVDDKIVEEVRRRLDRIDIDGVLEGGYIEEFIQDETYTPFPTVFNTERPDTVAAGLLEGRVAILVDGTPFVLLVPVLFAQNLQAAEDYYQRADIATLLRVLRYVGFMITMLGPSIYIAVITFHQELIPTPLLISLAAQREGIPFPAFVEAMMMEITFEFLREAGIRMPKTVGQTISIVGALVIGQAAVEAGIVSAVMVIVVSSTAVASFILPAFNLSIAVRILRFVLMGLAASFGLFGVTIGLLALVLHLSSLRSFGVPYLSPFAPFVLRDQKDTIFRAPMWAMKTRPKELKTKNVKRVDLEPERED